jgi:transcriptional regulator with XRE-family HTH domain
MSIKDLFFDNELTQEEHRLYAKEDLIYNTTEDLLVLMEELGVEKTDLAKKLGKSKSFVSQVLAGSRNMTLGTLSDICFSLGVTPKVSINKKVSLKAIEDSQVHWSDEKLITDNLNRVVRNNNIIQFENKQDNWLKTA